MPCTGWQQPIRLSMFRRRLLIMDIHLCCLLMGSLAPPADRIIPAFRRRSPSQPADTACSPHTVICNYGNAQLPLNAKGGLHLSLSSSSEVDSDKYCCLTPQVRAAISKITPVALLAVELSDITTDPTCRLAATLCGEAHATDIRVCCTDCRSGAAMQ